MATTCSTTDTAGMGISGNAVRMVMALVGATAVAAQAPTPAPRTLAELRAALVAMPIEDLPGTAALQIRQWLSGEPLPEAVVVVVVDATSAVAQHSMSTDLLVMQHRWLELAVESGTRIGLDANATAKLPTTACCVVVHGEDFTYGYAFEGVLSPCPLLTIPIQVHDAHGKPVAGWAVPGAVTDAAGRAQWQVPAYRLAAYHHVSLNGPLAPAWGMVGSDEVIVDLRSPGAGRDTLPITLPATASLEIVGMHAGAPAEFGHVRIYWRPPFANNNEWRHVQGGAATVVHGLPVGIPLFVRRSSEAPRVLTLAAGRVTRHEVAVPAAPPQVRFRLVDSFGHGLRGASSHEGDTVLDGDRGELRVPVSTEMVFVRLHAHDGEEWSCTPFPTPQIVGTAMHDGGDLVLQPSSRSEYCSGQIFDTSWQPVQTRVWLSDGHAVWSATESDDEGRFRLCIGPWFEGPMTVRVPQFPCFSENEVERGARNVVMVVDSASQARASLAGGMLGLTARRLLGNIEVKAQSCSEPNRWSSTSLQRGGQFQLGIDPGTYDVAVTMADGTVLFAAKNLVVRAHEAMAPAALQQPLPATHRAVQLRFVDPQGHPCPVPGLTDDATASAQAVIPVGGTMLDLPQILQRVLVSADRDIVLDPVVVDVEVAGLPAASPWFFGLRVGATGHEAQMPIRALANGHGRMFVPRGVPLRAALFAMRYAANGQPEPLQFGMPTPLNDFVAEFTVPTSGVPGIVRLEAPASLAAQLAAIAASPAPR